MNKNNMYRNTRLVIAIAVFMIVTMACGTSASVSQTSTISTATTQANVNTQSDTQVQVLLTDTEVPVAPTMIPLTDLYLGDAIQYKGYVLTVIKVADPAKPGVLYQAETGKKLVGIEVNISNLSGDDLSVNVMDFNLLDKDGFKYSSDFGDMDNEIASVDISKGEQVQGWISFKIPDEVIPLTLAYSPSIFDTGLQANLTPPPTGHTPVSVLFNPNSPSSKIGDVVQQSGYSLSVKTVENPTTPGEFYQSRSGYKPVAIEIILANVSGSSALSSNSMETYLVDNNGFVYAAEIMEGRKGEIATEDLNVGEKVDGWVTFVIPSDANPSYIKYQLDVFSGSYLIAGTSK
jgi:hypothetical protein